ncbi:MAG: HutD family protein, partial [Rubrivivax sp.]
MADITQDGPFSPYPGVHRAFAVLEGAGVVLQWPEGGRMLGPEDEALHFAGEAAPGCRLVSGPTRDLNLMVRTSAGPAAMRRAAPGQQGPTPASPWRALYTHGGAVLQADGQALTLAPGSLWWDDTGPAGPRWELQSGRGAWWLEVCGPGTIGLSPDGKPGGMQTSPHGKPGAIQFAPHGKPWAMPFSPHRKLDAAAGPGGTDSVRAEPVEALQERPGSRTLRQAQGERWLTDRTSTGAGRAVQDRPLPFPLL